MLFGFVQVLAFGLSFTIDFGTSKGLGKHDFAIAETDRLALYGSEYAFTVLYNPALMTTKTSILIFYLRVAKDTQIILKNASYTVLAIVNIAGVVLTFLNGFQCKPTRAAYLPNVHCNCLSVIILWLCSVPVNVITDLAILVLPFPVLTSIQLPRKQKAILVFTFTLGIFVTVVDVIRIYFLQQVIDTQHSLKTQEQIGNSTDFAWTASMALMWSAVEVNTGIICACIPTLRPLFHRIMPAMITDRLRSKYASSHNFGSRPCLCLSHLGHGGPTVTEDRTGNQECGLGGGEVGTINFITTPDMNQLEPGNQSPRIDDIQIQDPGDCVYFGFIDIKGPKSMLTATRKESFKYCTIVTTLFFLWGFSKGLVITLGEQIKTLAHESIKQDIGLSASYSIGYFFGPLTVGQCVLRHGGFKGTFITGLCIYGTGALMFWPPAVLTSYAGFIVCQFVIGFGLSILETAANPFLALCGPPQYGEFRLLLAQGVQSTANVLSQVLSQKVLWVNFSTKSLINVQWTYLAITFFTVILVLVIYYMSLPEAPDAELQLLSENLPISISHNFFATKIPLIWITLALGVFAQFCYLGSQESILIWQVVLRRNTRFSFNQKLAINDYGIISQTTFTVGRFVFAGLCLIIRPRFLLLIAFMLGTVFAILVMTVYCGPCSVAMTAVFFFFEGPIFPLIFAIGLRGMGKWTKSVGAVFVSSACSGAIFPYVMYIMVHDNHKHVHYSFCVIVALFAFGTIFPLYLSLLPEAGRQIDPVPIREGRASLTASRTEKSLSDGLIGRLKKILSSMMLKTFGVHKGKRDSELPVVARRDTRV